MLKLLLKKMYRQRGSFLYFISLSVLLSLAFMTILGLYFSEISAGYRAIKSAKGYDLWVMHQKSKARHNFVHFDKKKLIFNADISAMIKQTGFLEENDKHEVGFALIRAESGTSKKELIEKVEEVSGLKVLETEIFIKRSLSYEMLKDSSSIALTLSVAFSLMLVVLLIGALFYQLIHLQRKLCYSFNLEGFKSSAILRVQFLMVSIFSITSLMISTFIFVVALFYLGLELSAFDDYLLLIAGVSVTQQFILSIATGLYFLAPTRERNYAGG